MRKTYKCSNIKFCMENENQRRTWEYLRGMTRKDGSYGKLLSDAFVTVLDSKSEIKTHKIEELSISPLKQREQELEQIERLFERILEDKFQNLKEILIEHMEKCFQEHTMDFQATAAKIMETSDSSELEHMQESELSEDMMSFAFAMDE